MRGIHHQPPSNCAAKTGIPDTLQWWLQSLDAPLASVDSIRGSKTSSDLREVRFVHQNGKRCIYIYIYMKRWDCRLYIVSYKYELHISMAHEHDLGIVSGRFKLIQNKGSLKVIPNSDATEICQGLHRSLEIKPSQNRKERRSCRENSHQRSHVQWLLWTSMNISIIITTKVGKKTQDHNKHLNNNKPTISTLWMKL